MASKQKTPQHAVLPQAPFKKDVLTMPQMLSAVPDLKFPGKRDRDLTRRPASQLRSSGLADFEPDQRISFFPHLNLRLPFGKLLVVCAVMVTSFVLLSHFSGIGAALEVFFSGFIYDPRNAAISGDPVITGMVDWLPIALVGLSIMVLAGLVINRASYRQSLQKAGPRLVTRPTNSARTSTNLPSTRPLAAKSDRISPDHKPLFLVPRGAETRHEAQEQVRLVRDARAAAIARAEAAEHLIVSGTVRIHQSEALVVPKRRSTLTTMAAKSAPPKPLSGVFFPAGVAPAKKPSPINAPRHHLSRAPHTPSTVL